MYSSYGEKPTRINQTSRSSDKSRQFCCISGTGCFPPPRWQELMEFELGEWDARDYFAWPARCSDIRFRGVQGAAAGDLAIHQRARAVPPGRRRRAAPGLL